MPSRASPHRKANLTPDYEARLLLNPEVVLNTDYELKRDVLLAFGITKSISMNVQFFDTDSKDISAADWSIRVRKREDKSDLELTYKKRYNIASGDVDAALAVASIDGFDADDTKYEAQVEWGLTTRVLSISRDKEARSPTNGADLPNAADSRKMLIDEAPGKFDDWRQKKWGTAALNRSRPYGPVFARRWIGAWGDLKLYVEAWPIRTDSDGKMIHIVEASFKTSSRQTAETEHSKLATYLEDKKWLLAQDTQKTQLILENY